MEAEFAAAHAIVINGVREPLHGHNWRATVTLEGPRTDAEGLLCDFHLVESVLQRTVARWHNRSLNDLEPFAAGLNPSAEHVARQIADEVAAGVRGKLPAGVRIASVRITEAPSCAATYKPERDPR